MDRSARLTRKLCLLAITLAMPALMAPNCFLIPTSVEIRSPRDGSVVDSLTVDVEVKISSGDADLSQVIVDGVDRTDEFDREEVGFDEILTASIAFDAPGAHRISAAGAGGLTQDSDVSEFEIVLPPFRTPNDVATGVVGLGETTTIRGEVTAVTLKLDADRKHLPQRYVLMKVTAGLGDASLTQIAWGLGARFEEAQWFDERIQLPYPGDVMEVTGTVGTELFEDDSLFGDEERWVLSNVTDMQIVSSPNPLDLNDVGETCSHDLDCLDVLICERPDVADATEGVCAQPPEPEFYNRGTLVRGAEGTCATHAECPIGQFCDDRYVVQDEDEDPLFAANVRPSENAGRYLCQVSDRNNATAADVCPRTVSVDDAVGGRFVSGKEICVEDKVWLSWFNPGDRDSHCQLFVGDPLRFPYGDGLPFAQFAAEIAPPYKDPENPFGPLLNRPADEPVILTGSIVYDSGHDWWEIHPMKWWTLNK